MLLWAGLAASGCTPAPGPLQQQKVLAFGTLIDVSLWNVDPDLAAQAFEILGRDLQYMHDAWHAWRPGELSRVNQLLESGVEFSTSPEMADLIAVGTRLSLVSDGLFNPAIGRLIALWGFHSDLPKATLPSRALIEGLVSQAPRMDDVHLDGVHARCANPAVRLDFGGFAKGYGVDRAMERLKGLGIGNALINAGGDLRAIGRHGDRPWRIGIRDPRGPGALALLEVAGDESVFTSGDYERRYEINGHAYHHIIDPRTGYPARGATSATVITAGDSTTADAAATALFIAGPSDWRRIAANMGLSQVMVVGEDGTVYMSPKMASRVRFMGEPGPRVVVKSTEDGNGGTPGER